MKFVDGFTVVLSGAAAGIGRVNAVCPGGIETCAQILPAEQVTAGRQGTPKMIAPLHPIDRIRKQQEMAELIVRLCSLPAAFTTGAIVPLDGGFVSQ